MPLVRGTAMTGYTAVLGLFWAAGIPITRQLPPDYCPDWDAILTQDPHDFVRSLSSKINPLEFSSEDITVSEHDRSSILVSYLTCWRISVIFWLIERHCSLENLSITDMEHKNIAFVTQILQ